LKDVTSSLINFEAQLAHRQCESSDVQVFQAKTKKAQ
jgi:hypothetical protein